MLRCNSLATAQAIARERLLAYGVSVHGGGWYVGTFEQLRAIGCPTESITHAPDPLIVLERATEMGWELNHSHGLFWFYRKSDAHNTPERLTIREAMQDVACEKTEPESHTPECNAANDASPTERCICGDE